MQVCRLAFLTTSLQAVTHSSTQAGKYTQVSRCSGRPTVPIKKIFFRKKTEKGKKKKKAILKDGRQAGQKESE